ncbi:MAG: hypothetical protein R6V50_06860 [Thermoplasmatota archaeon]
MIKKIVFSATFIGAILIILNLYPCTVQAYDQHSSKFLSLQATAEEDIEPHIDSSIYLTRLHIPMLRKTIRQLQDKPQYQFLQELIDMIECKGKVTSEDIKHVVINDHSEIVAIHHMQPLYADGIGTAGCFPLMILKSLFGIFFMRLPWLIPTLMLWAGDAKVTIGSWYYDSSNHTHGLVIGYVGYAHPLLEGPLYNLEFSFLFKGYGFLILVFE